MDPLAHTAQTADIGAPSHANFQIRTASRSDLDSLRIYFKELNRDSVYKRLFATSHAVPELFYAYFEQQDRLDSHRETFGSSSVGPTVIALLALGKSNGNNQSPIIGEAMMSINATSPIAEIGLSLSENHRRMKIGSALMQALLRIGISQSVTTIYADALRQNHPFIRLAETHGYRKSRHPDDWSLIRLTKLISPATSPGDLSSQF